MIVVTGCWDSKNLKRWVTFNRIAKDVAFDDVTGDFTVVAKNVVEDRVMAPETFNYFMVALGHYSVPNMPYFPGIEKFPRRVMHAHDFRDACEFTRKREIQFRTDFVLDLANEADYGHNLDVTQIFNDWETDKHKDILTYRDTSFASKFTGTKSPIHHSTFMEALDDSMATFLAAEN